MEIEIKYSVSEGPHKVALSQNALDEMLATGTLTVVQPTPKGHKTITITGTKKELGTLAMAIVKHISGTG